MNDDKLGFKIDTKEKMNVITFDKTKLAANLTEQFKSIVLPYLQKPVKNVILNLSEIESIDEKFAHEMANVQQEFYNSNASMVFCNISKEIMSFLNKEDLTDVLNITPTESEAWDIVQMEEIEREFL